MPSAGAELRGKGVPQFPSQEGSWAGAGDEPVSRQCGQPKELWSGWALRLQHRYEHTETVVWDLCLVVIPSAYSLPMLIFLVEG